ncbi:general substrate transporter [Cladochytrium replicatum]|nr:general substrate transporter [Cladochytrium replicatum]
MSEKVVEPTPQVVDAQKYLRAQTLDPDTPSLYSKQMWRNWFPVIIAVINLVACGYDQSMSWDITLLASFTDELVKKEAVALATWDSLTNWAGFIAAAFMPFAYDWRGRKFGFAFGNIVALIGSAISVFGSLDVQSGHAPTTYAVGRVIAVFGIDVAAGCSWMYAAEIAHPAHRAFFGGLFGISWNIGYIINNALIFGMSFMPYSSWQWRIPTIMQMVFSVGILAMLPFAPESPRTLVSKGKTAEAEEIVRKWVGCGTSSDRFVADQMEELEESLKSSPKTDKIWEVYNMKPLWASKNSGRRVFLFILTNAIITLLNWGATGGALGTLIYDAIGLSDSKQKTAINFANSIFSCVLGYITCMYLEVWGRRRTYLICYSISFVLGFLGATAMQGYNDSKNFSYAILYIVMVFVGTIYSAPMGPVKLLFESELLHYDYRAKGKALNDFTLKPTNVIVGYIQAALWNAIGVGSFWTAQGYTLIFLILHWFVMPETKNRTLEEVDEIFDHPSPFYTEWFNRNSGETNYVKHSLELLRKRQETISEVGAIKS